VCGQGRAHADVEENPGLLECLGGARERIDIFGRQVGQSVDARRERISLVVQAVIP